METKLAEFRARRLREMRSTSEKQTFAPNLTEKPTDQNHSDIPVVSSKTEAKLPLDANRNGIAAEPEKRLKIASAFDRKLDIAVIVLKFTIWSLLMTLFVHLEFGAVFFVFSVFYLMYRNFRSTPKKPGEISAYSVFNPNCENIEGALTAAQFERELMFRQT